MSTTDPSDNFSAEPNLADQVSHVGIPLQDDQTANFVTPALPSTSDPASLDDDSTQRSGNRPAKSDYPRPQSGDSGLKHSNSPAASGPTTSGEEPYLQLIRRKPEPASKDPASVYPNRYQRRGELGRGGWGVVDRVHDSQLERDVAVKRIIIPDDASDEARQRFLHEAKITSQLQHPGVVPVHELVEGNDQESTYYVMKLLEGETLRDHIRRQHQIDAAKKPDSQKKPLKSSHQLLERITPLLERFIDVCNAVGYAHQRGVIHRDLKSANIMVGEYGETVVVDWGLAVHENSMNEVEHTQRTIAGGAPIHSNKSAGFSDSDGTVIGTPAYMSPEQARGELLTLGPSSDIYSLGIILWEIVVGQHPYRGQAVDDILKDVSNAVRPSIKQQQPLIAQPLIAIIEKAIAASPSDRYETGAALANDVRQFMLGEPVSVHRESAVDRIARWCRRNRSLVGMIAVSTCILLAGSLVFGYLINLSREAERAARLSAHAAHESAFNRLVEARDSADTWLIDLSGSLEFYPGLSPIRDQLLRDAIDQYESITLASEMEANDGLPMDQKIRSMIELEHARCHLRLGDLYFLVQQKEKSKTSFELAAKMLSALGQRHPATMNSVLSDFGEATEVGLAQWIQLEQANAAIGRAFHNPDYVATNEFRNHRRLFQTLVPDEDELAQSRSGEIDVECEFRRKAVSAAVRLEIVAYRSGLGELAVVPTTAKLTRAAAWARWLALLDETSGSRRLYQTTQEALARYLTKTGQLELASKSWGKLIFDLAQWIEAENPRPDQLQSLAHARLMKLNLNKQNSSSDNSTAVEESAYRAAIKELNHAWGLSDSDAFYRTNLASAESSLAQTIANQDSAARTPEDVDEALGLSRRALATYQELLRENVSLDRLRSLAQTHHCLSQLLATSHSKNVSAEHYQHLTSADLAYQMIHDHGGLEFSDALNWYELSIYRAANAGGSKSDNDSAEERLRVLDHWIEGKDLNPDQTNQWERVQKIRNSTSDSSPKSSTSN